jgi:hypothetical protein
MKMENWEVDEKMPKYNDVDLFDVVVFNQVRTVKRIGNFESNLFAPGVLIFTDCNIPIQNVLVDESKITAWKIQ